MKTDEELWKQYNSAAQAGMSAEEKARAQAYAAANGQVFDSTVTQTEQDRRKLRDAAAVASRTPEQQEAMKEVYAPKEDTSTLGEKAISGLSNIASGIANGGEGSKAPADIGHTGGNVTTPSNETDATKPTETPPTQPPAGNTTTEPTDEEKEELQKFPAVQQAQSGVRSIMDAYADGTIDKNTRDYLIVDSIATFAKNLGKGVQNIGAAYTGGATQDADEQSQWEQQQQKDLEQQQQMKRESIAGSPEWRNAKAEMESLKGAELTNKINEIKSKYTEPQLMNMLKTQAHQLGMGDIAQKIANRKLAISDVFSEMSNNSKSELGQLGYGLLSTLSLDGGQSLMATGVNAFTSLF
jgi:hypothetical protein